MTEGRSWKLEILLGGGPFCSHVPPWYKVSISNRGPGRLLDSTSHRNMWGILKVHMSVSGRDQVRYRDDRLPSNDSTGERWSHLFSFCVLLSVCQTELIVSLFVRHGTENHTVLMVSCPSWKEHSALACPYLCMENIPYLFYFLDMFCFGSPGCPGTHVQNSVHEGRD